MTKPSERLFFLVLDWLGTFHEHLKNREKDLHFFNLSRASAIFLLQLRLPYFPRLRG